MKKHYSKIIYNFSGQPFGWDITPCGLDLVDVTEEKNKVTCKTCIKIINNEIH